MEFIEKSFEVLKEHCIKNGVDAKENDFFFINSLSTSINEDKISTFLLGVLLNRDKTPNNKIQKIGREYKALDNYYEVYYALYTQDLDKYAMLLRILSDFEEDDKKNKYRLLNSQKELKNSIIVDNFLNIKNSSNQLIGLNSVFLKVELNVKTLQNVPETVMVSDVEIKTKRMK